VLLADARLLDRSYDRARAASRQRSRSDVSACHNPQARHANFGMRDSRFEASITRGTQAVRGSQPRNFVQVSFV